MTIFLWPVGSQINGGSTAASQSLFSFVNNTYTKPEHLLSPLEVFINQTFSLTCMSNHALEIS